MLGKLAAMEGTDTVHMAQRVAQFAPSLANGAELSGFAKVMANLGAFGSEPGNYAKVIWLAGRFTTPITDLSDYGTLALGRRCIVVGRVVGGGLAERVRGRKVLVHPDCFPRWRARGGRGRRRVCWWQGRRQRPQAKAE